MAGINKTLLAIILITCIFGGWCVLHPAVLLYSVMGFFTISFVVYALQLQCKSFTKPQYSPQEGGGYCRYNDLTRLLLTSAWLFVTKMLLQNAASIAVDILHLKLQYFHFPL